MPTPTSPLDASLEHLREAASLLLWEIEAVRVRPEEPFRLASGQSSPIYINCRRAISEPAFMELFVATARLLLERSGVDFTTIAGGETAGIPYAAYLASGLGKPLVYVRKKAKGYGLASRVEGHVEKGAKVLLVEDLITDGGSKLGFLDALEAAGGTVADALVVFDRQQGGGATLGERDVRLHAVTDRATTLAAGEAAGLLDGAAKRAVEAYFRDPDAWQETQTAP